jgi:hypothetical protein
MEKNVITKINEMKKEMTGIIDGFHNDTTDIANKGSAFFRINNEGGIIKIFEKDIDIVVEIFKYGLNNSNEKETVLTTLKKIYKELWGSSNEVGCHYGNILSRTVGFLLEDRYCVLALTFLFKGHFIDLELEKFKKTLREESKNIILFSDHIKFDLQENRSWYCVHMADSVAEINCRIVEIIYNLYKKKN